MSKILVTGGAGFIGSHVVEAFIAEGHDVVIVDNLVTGRREFVHPDATFVELDICSPELADVFAAEQPDIVDHFAAQMNVTLSLKDPLYDARNNILGTLNVLQQCVDYRCKKFLFASSSGVVYGQPDSLPVTEAAPAQPLSHYGVSKCSGEYYTRLYHSLYQLPYVIFRYANVFGPRQYPHGECGVCAVLTELMLAGKQPTLYGHGDPVRDYVFVGDVARANVLALERGNDLTANVASGRGTTVMEVFTALKRLTGFDGDPILAPIRAGEVAAIYASRDLAQSALGWQPAVSLEEGLAETVAYYRDGTEATAP